MIRRKFFVCLLLLQQYSILIQTQSSNNTSIDKSRFISSTIISTILHHEDGMYRDEEDDDISTNIDSYNDEDEEEDFYENHFSSTPISQTDFPNMTSMMQEDASISDYNDEAGSYQEDTEEEPRIYADTMSITRPDSRRPSIENSIDSSSTSRIFFVHPNLWKDFFSKPTILVGIIGGISLGVLSAILLVMFIIYRMRKKDEGSYALEEAPRKSPSHAYARVSSREFFA